MLPAPKIVKAESNHTDLHAKIAEPPPIFYKDSEKNTPCQMKRHLSIIRKSKCSTDFKRNDFLKKNEAYPLGALRSLKFAYRKLRISLFVELAV